MHRIALEGMNRVGGVGGRPAVGDFDEGIPALVVTLRGHVAGDIEHIVAHTVLEDGREVDPIQVETGGEAAEEVGIAVADDVPVFVRDDMVPVQVLVLDITWLDGLTHVGGRIRDALLERGRQVGMDVEVTELVDPVPDVAVHVAEGFSDAGDVVVVGIVGVEARADEHVVRPVLQGDKGVLDEGDIAVQGP